MAALSPAHAEVTLNPHIAANIVYDDNIYLSAVNKEYDVNAAINPGLELRLTEQTGELLLSYNPAYSSYVRFPENNYWRHDAALNGRLEVASGLQFEFSDAFLRTEDPLSDIDTTVRRGRNPYITNTAAVGIVNRFGADDVVALRYAYYFLKNDDPTIEDKSYQRPSLLMTYWLSPNQVAVELEGSYTISEFDVSEDFNDTEARIRLIRRFGRHFDAYVEYGHVYTDYLDEGEDYSLYSPLVGFTWQQQQNVFYAASVGYFYRNNDKSADDDGIVGNLEVVYNWAEGSSITLTGEAGVNQASYGAENLGFNPYYGANGTLSHQLSRLVVGNIIAGYRLNQYTDQTPEREDTIWQAGCGIAIQALPWMSVRLDYLFVNLDSTRDTEDYTDNRGILSVVLAPRQGIKLFQ